MKDRAYRRRIEDIRGHANEQFIIKIIKRMSKASKFKYVSKESILAEAEQEFIRREVVEEVLDALLHDKIIYEPVEMNYRMVRKGL